MGQGIDGNHVASIPSKKGIRKTSVRPAGTTRTFVGLPTMIDSQLPGLPIADLRYYAASQLSELKL